MICAAIYIVSWQKEQELTPPPDELEQNVKRDTGKTKDESKQGPPTDAQKKREQQGHAAPIPSHECNDRSADDRAALPNPATAACVRASVSSRTRKREAPAARTL